jgi:formamidopyrimidine-DNA glycosylase
MPELPEVEVLVRHLEPLLRNQTICSVEVSRARVLRPTTTAALREALTGAVVAGIGRRGKYLVFKIRPRRPHGATVLVGHLGMTGRMYLLPKASQLPKHCAVILNLGAERFVFEDTRYFGRFTLDTTMLHRLGPEPLNREFTPKQLGDALARSEQAIKVKLLDQTIVAGIGNIYASEALFQAGISPRMAARRLNAEKVERLWRAIRATLSQAIKLGSTVPLDYEGRGGGRLFYYGRMDAATTEHEIFRVYDRQNLPCLKCRSKIKRIVQAARSTFYCPVCQKG